MPWVRLDEQFAWHPKLARVGPLGMALQVAALCYSNRHLTDGFVPWSIAQGLLTWEFATQDNRRYKIGISCGMAGQDVTSDFVIPLLLEADIWEQVEGGYRIHNFRKYQPTKKQVLEERSNKQAAGRAGGQASAKARAKAERQAESKPVPVPIPSLPLLNPSGLSLEGEGSGVSEPDWYKELKEIGGGFERSFKDASVWLSSKGIGAAHAEETALALKAKWPPSKQHKDVWATFQQWVQRPPLIAKEQRNGSAHGRFGAPPLPGPGGLGRLAQLDRRQAEARREAAEAAAADGEEPGLPEDDAG